MSILHKNNTNIHKIRDDYCVKMQNMKKKLNKDNNFNIKHVCVREASDYYFDSMLLST